MASEIGRIESEIILNRIAQHKTKIILQYIKNRFPVIVDSVAGTKLMLRRVNPAEEMLLVGRAVQLFFEYHGSEMTILPRVIRDQGEQIELIIEKPAYRDISRTFERVYNDSTIRIIALDESTHAVSRYPHTIRNISERKLEKYTSGLPSEMSSLIQSYFDALQQQNIIAKITLFREHPPKYFAEKVSAYLGHPLIIPYPESDADALPIVSRSSLRRVAQEMKFSPSHAMLTEQQLIPGFESSRTQIIVPIIHLTYCVGYAFVAAPSLTTEQYKTNIDLMDRYACALSVTLDKNGYFDDLTQSKDTGRILRLINISASGLRFSYKAAKAVYAPGDDVRLAISFPWNDAQREFLVSARVIHINEYAHLHYAAVQFVEPDPALFLIINDYLYQRKRS